MDKRKYDRLPIFMHLFKDEKNVGYIRDKKYIKYIKYEINYLVSVPFKKFF